MIVHATGGVNARNPGNNSREVRRVDMETFEIVCCNLSRAKNGEEFIGQVGVRLPDGSIEIRYQTVVINDIRAKRAQYVVKQGGFTAEVVIGVSANHNDYLTTVADRVKADNLLSLPECGAKLPMGPYPPDSPGDEDGGGGPPDNPGSGGGGGDE
jgi:hypothetical protein